METALLKVRVISNKKLKCNYWHLEFECGMIARNARPGQFVEVKVNHLMDPLLRRPLSIHGVSGTRVRIIYEVIGKGTQILSEQGPGVFLDVIGPLGKGFEYGQITNKADKQKNILVAGGMGVAPLVFLAQRMKGSRPLVLIGAKTKEHILCEKEFKSLGCKIKIATDDGSRGFKGRVTDLLKDLLSTVNCQLSTIYACGPQPMLKAVARISCENNLASQLSLERHMACGFGACLGCVVSTKSGYKRVCKDGPVFAGEELTW
ncbi:MAG: dihydroorotate dehydrogenase electron transfer subunit [Candidatus Omnitrophica bacterium]|nr:dihydroorotate dehydrogenase electron transfer subunit [Candidatus Omnitrophota bacterium]